MKKLIALLMTVLMVLAMTTPALAVGATFANTSSFLDVMDEKGFIYTLVGVDEDGDEKVTVEDVCENFSATIRLYFSPENDLVDLYTWEIIAFDDEDLADVLLAVNQANCDYRYVRFYVDMSDNTVSADMNVIVREDENAGEIVLEAAGHMANIMDEVYETLASYAK